MNYGTSTDRGPRRPAIYLPAAGHKLGRGIVATSVAVGCAAFSAVFVGIVAPSEPGGAAAFALVFSALCLVLARVAAAGWRLIAFDERGVAQIDQLGRVRSVPWARVDRVVTAQQLLRGWLWREILRVWWWTSPGPLHLGFVVSATMIVVETRDWVCACWATREDLAALQERGFLWVG